MCPHAGWTADDDSNWDRFFKRSDEYAVSERRPFSVQRLHPKTPSHTDSPPEDPTVVESIATRVPEPLVCTTLSAALSWKQCRHQNGQQAGNTNGQVLKRKPSLSQHVWNLSHSLWKQISRLGTF